MNPNQPITLTLSPVSATPGGATEWKLGVAQPTHDDGRPTKYTLARDNSTGLFRATAARDIYNAHGTRIAREGEVSGLLWGEGALAQAGGCWVGPDAKVLTRSVVYGDARLTDSTVADDGARIYGCAVVSDYAQVSSGACVYGNARVSGRAVVTRFAQVRGDCTVEGYVCIGGDARVVGGQFYEQVNIEAKDLITIQGGCWQGNIALRCDTDFLQINTRWGTMTVARTADGGWLGNVGCQRFNDFEQLVVLAREYRSTEYEQDLLQHWFPMMRRAFQQWSVPADVVAATTKLNEE